MLRPDERVGRCGLQAVRKSWGVSFSSFGEEASLCSSAAVVGASYMCVTGTANSRAEVSAKAASLGSSANSVATAATVRLAPDEGFDCGWFELQARCIPDDFARPFWGHGFLVRSS